MDNSTPDLLANTPKEPVNIPVRPRRGGVWFIAFVALLFSILSLAAQFYWWQLQQQLAARLESETQALAQNNTAQIHGLATQLENQQKILNTLVSLSHEEQKKTTVLLAQEAEHLLTLAQYSLMFENNSDLATKLVLNADQKLQEANDPALTTVRKELANSIIALNATPKVDVTGIVARLDAISNQVGTLSVIPAIAPNHKIQTSAKSPLTWKDKLMATLQHLQGLITIRRLQEPVEPLATPEQHVYLLETIRLKLAQAQWAVLHQYSDIYQKSLEDAKKNLNQYYAMNPVGVRLISMMTELQQINIKPPVPNLTSALTQLRSFINSAQTQQRTAAPISKTNEPLPAPPQSPTDNAPIPTALPS